jgi:histidinol-phosphate/aromatic aminotransferase/cobyric acid decarboxylase-like protein/adenosyl cobinamide kinase/adenosyl cobinamide phosphate guanylyltransferase
VSLALVIGGTRSGKSAHGERLALASALPVRYVATADGEDPSMARRIRAHVTRRPASWETVEAGARLAESLAGARDACVLIDGLGVWIAGAMEHIDVLAEVDALLDAIAAPAGPALTIVVAEQAGQGLLPADAVARAWLDLLGEATQRLAERASTVELVVAGRPLGLPAAGGRSAAPSPAVGPDRVRDRRAATSPAVETLRVHGDRAVRPGDADHAVNVLAGGPPDWLADELREALAHDAGRYPDERAASAALAALHGREAEEVVATNGASEALWLIPAALRPRLAACVHPAFTEAEAALRAHGLPVVRVLREREADFALDPTAVPAEADLVVLGNPVSPTGTLDPAAALLALRRRGRVLVVDEAFMELIPGEPGSLAGERLDDVIVVRSLTKALSVPGLRAGYAVAGHSLAARMRAVRPPWSANALALAALAAAARRPDALAALAARASAEREDLQRRLAGVAGVRTWPSATNFCLVEVADGPSVVRALGERRIAVRAAASFPGLGADDLRLTARGPRENARLVDAIAEALARTVELPVAAP